MYLSNPSTSAEPVRQRRQFARYDLQCRSIIRIGARQYAGYIQNISRGGARLRTISPIRKVGKVILRLPDLPPLRAQLRWTDSYNAGVSFELALSHAALSQWVQARLALRQSNQASEREIADLEFVV